MSKIPIIVTGLGWVGVNRHINAIRRNSEFELIGVIDRRTDRAKNYAQQFGLKHWAQAESLKEVPWINNAQAITISTPPHSHFKLVTEALQLGLHVLTEKPFAMNIEEGEQMLATAQATSRTLAVVHNFQFASSANMLSRDINNGRLGKIQRIHAMQLSNPLRRLPPWYEELPGGLFYDESPHLLYLINRFSPSPLILKNTNIIPNPEGKNTPALVQALYMSESPDRNIPITLDMDFQATLSEWHLAIIGDKEMGIVDIFRDIYLRLPNDGAHTTKTVLRTSLSTTLQHWKQHFTSGIKHLRGTLDYGNNEIYRRFLESVKTGETPQYINAENAIQILSMQHQLLESSYS